MRATFPLHLLSQEVIVRPVGMSLEPQQAISGAMTTVPTFGGHWEVTASFVLRGEEAQLAWQAFRLQMEGRVGTTLVPIRSRYRSRDRDGHSVYGCGPVGFADAQTFEHWGFDSAPVATMTLAAPAPLRATTIRARLNNTTGLRPGQYFSIGERLYGVQNTWRDADGTINLMIWPPLREAAATGTVMVLDRPVCRMQMTSETDGEFDQLLDRLPRVTCNFAEAV